MKLCSSFFKKMRRKSQACKRALNTIAEATSTYICIPKDIYNLQARLGFPIGELTDRLRNVPSARLGAAPARHPLKIQLAVQVDDRGRYNRLEVAARARTTRLPWGARSTLSRRGALDARETPR